MQSSFPQFSYDRQDGESVWRGNLRPTKASCEYEVEVRWRPPREPRVRVVSPPLEPGARHTYGDGSLCLHYPEDCSWTTSDFFATYTVPWTAEYLFWYEIWLETGKWRGPEKLHNGVKRRS